MTGGDTIAAVATAPGRGGVAVVRVSGPDSWSVAERVTGRTLRDADAGRFFRCRFHAVHRDVSGGTCRSLADSGLMLVFKGPHSYTGEDTVEFHGHGGSVAPRRVLEACFAAGARPARRGEFTQRAFLNGKIDLSAAEAVIDLVDARTDRSAEDAQSRLCGELSRRYDSLYAEALELSSSLEHMLDVSEDEIPDGTMEAVAATVSSMRRQIGNLLSTAHEGRILRDGALVVLAGAPNAGKSSLLNALLGESRAIVSDVAGTTRDAIEEGVVICGWPVRLVDTAGLRETLDAIEAEGVRRAESLMVNADVVVALDCDICGAIMVHAKCDLDGDSDMMGGAQRPVRVSSKTGEGLEELRRAIADRLAKLAEKGGEESADVTARHVELLERADAALAEADVAEPVIAANSARRAAEAIGQIVGKTYSEDLLDSIFSRFCVGK